MFILRPERRADASKTKDQPSLGKTPAARSQGYAAGQKATKPPPAPSASAAAPVAAAAEKPLTPREIFAKGQEAYHAGDFATAATLYLQVYKSGEGNAGGFAFNIAQCHRKLGALADAARWYRLALESGGVEEYRDEIEGRLATCNKDAAKADKEAATARARAMDPETGPTAKQRFDAATKAFNGGAYLRAIQMYSEFASDGLDSPSLVAIACFNTAQSYRLLGNNLDAINWYERALATGASNLEPYRGEIDGFIATMKAGLEPEARAAKDKAPKAGKGGKKKAPKKDPVAEAKATFEQAQDLYQHGYFEAACDLYVEVYYSPGLPDLNKTAVAFNIAQCFRKTNDSRNAITWYERTLELGGDDFVYAAEVREKLATLRGGAEDKTARVEPKPVLASKSKAVAAK